MRYLLYLYRVNVSLTHEAWNVYIVILFVDVKYKNTFNVISILEFCISFSSDHYLGVFSCLADAPPSLVALRLPFRACFLLRATLSAHPIAPLDIAVSCTTTPLDVSPSTTCTTTEDVTDALDAPLPEGEGVRFCARARRSSPVRYGIDLLAPPAGPCWLELVLPALAAYSRAGSPPWTPVPLFCSTTVRRALLWAVCS